MPKTPDSLISTFSGNTNARTLAVTSLGGEASFQRCPDESPTTDNALQYLAQLWADGVQFDNQAASIAVMKTGITNRPTTCITLDYANLRSNLPNGWMNRAGGQIGRGNPEINAAYAAMIKLPDYPHVHELWLKTARANGIATLPTPGSDMVAWAAPYSKAASIVAAHAPSNVNCMNATLLKAGLPADAR